MKRYLTIIIVLLFTFVIKVNAEDYETGELIKYKGIKFYVMEDKGDYLTLLKATPFKLDELKQYTEYFSSSGDDYYMGRLKYCKTDDSDCTFEESNVKYALDNWSKMLDDKDLVSDEITYDEYRNSSNTSVNKKYKIRLLTKNELIEKFGYVHNVGYHSNLKTPKWLTNYNCLLMDYNYILSEGYVLFGSNYSTSTSGSVFISGSENALRPVINLKKKADIKKLKSPVKSINDGEFKIGDIVEYNGIEYYVIKDSTKNDKTITMIKTMPLTKKEVETYDSKYTSIGTQYDINDEENDLIDTYKYIPYYYRENGCSKTDDNKQCKNDYESSDVKQIVDKWADEHVNTNDLTKDETGYDVRIISVNDLTDNLGYVSSLAGPQAVLGGLWLHQTEGLPFNLMDCWTMTPVSKTQESEYKIQRFSVEYANVYGDLWIGSQGVICPVITVNKKVAAKENNSANNTINIPDTLLKNPIFIVVIGIILIVIATVTVSLILKRKK